MMMMLVAVGLALIWGLGFHHNHNSNNNKKKKKVVETTKAMKLDDDADEMKKKMRASSSTSRVPKGSSGWPFLGETLDFISSSYTSKPVSFMLHRKSLYVSLVSTPPSLLSICLYVCARAYVWCS